MLGNMTALNLLGINNAEATLERSQRLLGTQTDTGPDPVFAASLKAALAASREHPMPQQTDSPDAGNSNGVRSIVSETLSLVELYKKSMIQGLGDDSSESDMESNNASAVFSDDDNSDPISSDIPKPSEIIAAAEPDPIPTSTPVESISSVVFATGDANMDLVNKISNASTMEERLGYATELRDKIVTALKSAGYNAEAANKTDKLSVDGQIYDVIKASKGLGRDSRVQLLKVDGNSASIADAGNSTAEAIFKAGETGINLLRRISTSHNVSERRHLAAQIQHLMVENLNANGYNASIGGSPDKIVVDGVTYDVIQGLNSAGSRAQFQAIKV